MSAAVFHIRDHLHARGLRRWSELWFRGADREHDPIPSLLRNENANEWEIRREFWRLGILMLSEREPQDESQWTCGTTVLLLGCLIGPTAP